MATLTVQEIRRSGLTPAYVAAAGGGDAFLPTLDTFLHIKNGGGGSITVTVVTPREHTPDVAVTDLAVSVTNGQERMIGPFPADDFADPTDGLADITYSGVTSVTIGIFKLRRP